MRRIRKRKRTPLTFLRFAMNETLVYRKVKKLERTLSQNFMELGVAAYNQQKGTSEQTHKIETLTKEADRLVCEINECFNEMYKKSLAIKYSDFD